MDLTPKAGSVAVLGMLSRRTAMAILMIPRPVSTCNLQQTWTEAVKLESRGHLPTLSCFFRARTSIPSLIPDPSAVPSRHDPRLAHGRSCNRHCIFMLRNQRASEPCLISDFDTMQSFNTRNQNAQFRQGVSRSSARDTRRDRDLPEGAVWDRRVTEKKKKKKKKKKKAQA
jgi:hypothetical protein